MFTLLNVTNILQGTCTYMWCSKLFKNKPIVIDVKFFNRQWIFCKMHFYIFLVAHVFYSLFKMGNLKVFGSFKKPKSYMNMCKFSSRNEKYICNHIGTEKKLFLKGTGKLFKVPNMLYIMLVEILCNIRKVDSNFACFVQYVFALLKTVKHALKFHILLGNVVTIETKYISIFKTQSNIIFENLFINRIELRKEYFIIFCINFDIYICAFLYFNNPHEKKLLLFILFCFVFGTTSVLIGLSLNKKLIANLVGMKFKGDNSLSTCGLKTYGLCTLLNIEPNNDIQNKSQERLLLIKVCLPRLIIVHVQT
ncbi:hypothetical protein KUTeg_017688 [Tegillarca granosa]|uniref:Uncharacterized protein n=1 Tax=Tegillarca granosa TaxID=220873 RepID=A0ABQ9EKP2_TEGGR|nr:hypothetical protein KUTeg_017688 [Tegillarca granosa]